MGVMLCGCKLCFAERRFTGAFDRLPDQFCRLLDRLSDQFAKHRLQECLTGRVRGAGALFLRDGGVVEWPPGHADWEPGRNPRRAGARLGPPSLHRPIFLSSKP